MNSAYCSFKINVSHMTPQMLMWLATDPSVDRARMGNLRSMILSGAPIDANLANQAKRKMNLKDIRQSKLNETAQF